MSGKLFKDKTVFITGASSGFGTAFAIAFAREGARLILLARRKERLDQLAKQLKKEYETRVETLVVDVTDYQAVGELVNSLPIPLATPDILINNAGLVRGFNKLWETPNKDWNEMIDTNIKGILNVSHHIIPKMIKANSGHIINIGSISGHDTYPGGSIYCATKFAVTALTETLRKELVATPIRVSLVSPGMANTEFSKVRFYGDQAKADEVYKGIEPLTSEDVAEAVMFIASRPKHVNIADIVLYPTNQASVSIISRSA